MSRPYFFWDYNLDEKKIRQILKKGSQKSRLWLAARILESANFKDVWRYFSLAEVRKIFPRLRLKKPVKQAWQRAFQSWSS